MSFHLFRSSSIYSTVLYNFHYRSPTVFKSWLKFFLFLLNVFLNGIVFIIFFFLLSSSWSKPERSQDKGFSFVSLSRRYLEMIKKHAHWFVFFSFHLDVSFFFISFLNIILLPSMVNMFVNLCCMFVL